MQIDKLRQSYRNDEVISLRCRRFGQAEWTDVFFNGPAEQSAFSAAGAGLATGSFQTQMLEAGEWVDIAELDFDDGKELE